VPRHAKSRGFTTKTGIRLGLGATQPEIKQCLLVRSSYHADEPPLRYTGVEHLNTHNTLASV